MVKKLFCLFLCFAFILTLGGCSAKPGVEFDGENIWTDPDAVDNTFYIRTQEILEEAITSKDADKLTVELEPIENKAIIRDFQEWLSKIKLSPLSDSIPPLSDELEVHAFELWAEDEELCSLSVRSNGIMVVSYGIAFSFMPFYTIDNFEDIKADYEKLLEKIEEAK